jgi:hypothetical protein
LKSPLRRLFLNTHERSAVDVLAGLDPRLREEIETDAA